MVQLLAGAFVGAAAVPAERRDYGLFMLAMRPDLFAPREHYEAGVREVVRRIKSVKRMAGRTEVLIPGERAFRERDRRLREGIEISDEQWCGDLGERGKDGDRCRVTSSPAPAASGRRFRAAPFRRRHLRGHRGRRPLREDLHVHPVRRVRGHEPDGGREEERDDARAADRLATSARRRRGPRKCRPRRTG